MEALVEVHDEAERDIALECGVRILGVNNRNLKNFTTDLSTTERLVRGLDPEQHILVGESGIHKGADSRRMKACGCCAILVGESLMRRGEQGCPELLKELTLRV